MTEERKDSKSKIIIILLIVVIVVLIGGAAAFILLNNNHSAEDTGNGSQTIQESNSNPLILKHEAGAVAMDGDSLQKMVDEIEKNQDGMITLDFSPQATSMDGRNFECNIGNALENTHDIFVGIYMDDTFTQQIFVSGLFSPGECLAEFESEIELEPGLYDTILVLTQVDDKGEAMISQTRVVLQLKVG